MTKQIFEGEYQLGLSEPDEIVELAPGLLGVLLEEKNNLCPSRYDRNIVCVSAGSITVRFKIGNQIVELNDDDFQEGRKTTFQLNCYKYEIYGKGNIVKNMDRNKTYLLYEITRYYNNSSTACFRLAHGRRYTDGRSD